MTWVIEQREKLRWADEGGGGECRGKGKGDTLGPYETESRMEASVGSENEMNVEMPQR